MIATRLSPTCRQLARLACVCIVGLAALTSAKAEPAASSGSAASEQYLVSLDQISDAPALKACRIASAGKLGKPCWAAF